MIKLAIVCNKKNNVAELKAGIDNFKKIRGDIFNFETYVFEDETTFITNYRPVFDIVIIDMELTYFNGIYVAKRLRTMDENVNIVMMGSIEQAILGYEVGALGYLSNPIDACSVETVLSRVLVNITNNSKKTTIISLMGGHLKRIDVSRVKYIEVFVHQLVYHTTSGIETGLGTLQKTEEQFKEFGFYRCSKNTIINFNYVEQYKSGVVYIGENQINVSRRKKKEFEELFENYVLSNSRYVLQLDEEVDSPPSKPLKKQNRLDGDEIQSPNNRSRSKINRSRSKM